MKAFQEFECPTSATLCPPVLQMKPLKGPNYLHLVETHTHTHKIYIQSRLTSASLLLTTLQVAILVIYLNISSLVSLN